MVEPHRRLTEARELKALAHPVRMAIVEQLSISGPLTATQLAGRLGETPANCSWHLRKLAEFGFVEEADGGTGRQRPWQVPGLGYSYGASDDTSSPDTRRAAEALADVMMARAVDRLREAHRRAPDEPAEWREAMNTGETVAWLTAEELHEMNDALHEVLSRFDGRLSDSSARPAGARLCEFVAWGVPAWFPGVEDA